MPNSVGNGPSRTESQLGFGSVRLVTAGRRFGSLRIRQLYIWVWQHGSDLNMVGQGQGGGDMNMLTEVVAITVVHDGPIRTGVVRVKMHD